MSDVPVIRLARIGDAQAINQLCRYLGYEPLSTDVLMENLENILASKSARLQVFERDNTILGWIQIFSACRVALPTFIEFGGMVGSPSCRRQGIGQNLVQQARQWESEKKLNPRVCCNSNRMETHRFYKAVGFVLSKSQNVFEMRL